MIYTGFLNEKGGYESDITIIRMNTNEYFVISPTAHTGRDVEWFEKHSEGYNTQMFECTSAYTTLTVMGPKSRGLLAELTGADFSNEGFPFMTS